MSTPEAIGYVRPENPTRPEIMRNEVGPVLTLITMRAIDRAQRTLETYPQSEISESEPYKRLNDLSNIGHVVADTVLDELGGANDEYDAAVDYTFYHPLSTQLRDGLVPQVNLTCNFILPGFITAKAKLAPWPTAILGKLGRLSYAQIAGLLQEPEYINGLVAYTKTANGLLLSGDSTPEEPFYEVKIPDINQGSGLFLKKITYFDPLKPWLQLADPDDTSSLVTALNEYRLPYYRLFEQKEDGTVGMSQEARTLLACYFRSKNEVGLDIEKERSNLGERAYIRQRSVGCPVSVRTGKFPFNIISSEKVINDFGGILQDDGGIVVPNIMTITAEGEYHYHNPSPAIIGFNQLFAKQVAKL